MSLRSAILRFPVAIAALALIGFAPKAASHFVDDFARPDSASIGNGWIEKNAAAFSIVNGQATKLTVGSSYRDNAVYRPAGEDILDVEASLEISFIATPPGYPQVFVRLQSATAANPDTLDAYLLYLPDSGNSAIVGRQSGSAFVTTLATFNFAQTLNTTDRYRMRLRAVGANPVQLAAFVERLVGGIWQTIGQTSVADAAANRIAVPGSVGFSGYVESSYRYDSFARVDLGAVGTANPAPVATAISPATAVAGESGFPIVVYGSGFTTDSVIRWNGSNRLTTYVSPSELEASINATDLAVSGNAAVTVFNPTPTGGESQALTFQVLSAPPPATPSIVSLAPVTTVAGSAGFTLTVTGSGFNSGSQVRWNGAGLSTTFISASELRASVTASNVSAPGTVSVTVYRQSDGAVSAPSNFSVTTPPTPGDFLDNFTRADNASIGNGWIEKAATAFSVTANEVAKVGAGGNDYRNNIVYRPAAEDLLDAEAAIELRFLSLPTGYPQVLVRAQSATIANAAQLDAYLLYINDSSTQAVLARQRGGSYDTPLVTFGLTSALNTTDRYRLRLRAEGTNPVQLAAFVERFVSGNWQVIGQATFSDAATARISTAGSVGFGGYVETNYRYDNFARVSLGSATPNPSPVASALNPASAVAGSTAVQLTVTGNNFIPGSVVRWNGADRTTTYVNGNQLVAQIMPSDLAAPTVSAISVFNPAPGGGTSAALSFTVTAAATNPVPISGSLNPASGTAGGPAFNLAVLGSNFVAGTIVRWNGGDRTTTFVSANEVRAAISAGDIAAAGSATVTVFNPAPGGGLSGALTFQITTASNPIPTTSGLMPSSVVAGSPGLTLTVVGTNFVGASIVRWNGSNRTTTYVSSTELRATIASVDLTSSGTRTVTVFNPSPGGGTSNGQTFTISAQSPNNPVPQITQINPMAQPTGGTAFALSVLGSGFTSQSVVRWNGQTRTTTLISATELRADIPASDLSTAGIAAITVSTPSPGGGSSLPLTFFVQDGSVNYFFDGFNRINNAVVGNGWIEKNAAAFSIQDGELLSTATAYGFAQDIMHRPAVEDRLNVEASVEFRRLASQPTLAGANFPQVHARVQQDSVTQFNTLDSYIFFIDDVTTTPTAMFAVTRAPQPGVRWECYIAALPLSTALVEGGRYRLRLSVTGTSPVVLNGRVEQFTNGAWTTLAVGTTTHSPTTQRNPNLYCDQPTLPAPITNAGGVGVAKWTNRTDVYDNFYWREIEGVPSPPVIGTLAPSSIVAGSAAFQLIVTGSGFGQDSIVRWNGANRTTTYISTTEVRAAINAADVATAGSAAVTVFGSSTGQTSNQINFDILPAAGQQTLFDDFSRADGAAIGNSWIEKNANAFSLQSGRALKLNVPDTDYRNNIVYRPAAEDLLNPEASLEFRLLSQQVGYPALLVRVQASTVGIAQRFDGYLLYLNDNPNQAVLARQTGTGYDEGLALLNFPEPLNQTDTYRMRLSAYGTNPVQLRAYVERLVGGSWQNIAQAALNDAATQRISTPGSVGFGGYVENTYSFDNFRRLDLGP